MKYEWKLRYNKVGSFSVLSTYHVAWSQVDVRLTLGSKIHLFQNSTNR
ncbi:hypothetical protein LINPERHAP1_LOCUS31039, partial [Linum perenne]